MVDIKLAVERAKRFARDALGVEWLADVRLEEIESSIVNGEPVWLITLSNPLRSEGITAAGRAIAAALGADMQREYKVFEVAKDSGEVRSMKIRLFATPAQ
jgi:hypothetical protein